MPESDPTRSRSQGPYDPLRPGPRLSPHSQRWGLPAIGAAAHPGESLEAIVTRELPSALQPYVWAVPGLDVASNGFTEDSLLGEVAERTIAMPVTCLAGTAGRLARLFTQAKRLTGRQRIAEIWPQ